MSGCLCSGRQEGVLRLQNSSGCVTHTQAPRNSSVAKTYQPSLNFMFSPGGDLLIVTPKLSMFESRTGISSHRVCLKYLDLRRDLKRRMGRKGAGSAGKMLAIQT